MTDLHELTRKLVRRGCPEPGTISYHDKESCAFASWLLMSQVGHVPVSESVARAIWTLWALEWWLAQADTDHNRQINAWNNGGEHSGTVCQCETRDCTSEWTEDWVWGNAGQGPTILEAIEAATRHLDPKS